MSSVLAMHGVRHLELGAMHSSHAQLGRAPVSMHTTAIPGQQSVLNATGVGDVGVLRHAPQRAHVQPPEMSAAVLMAAQNLARELQELQDEFLAEHYSHNNGQPPKDSKYIQSSWAQMSVMDSLMGQLHSEVARESSRTAALPASLKREAAKSKGNGGEWRDALRENSKSAESTRLSKWAQQDNAARLIQHAWRQYRLRGIIRMGMRRKWELHRKYVAAQLTASVEEDLRHRRQLAMREATATAKENGKVAESGKFGSDPLAGWQATVPGMRNSWIDYNSQPKAVLSAASSPEPFLPEISKPKHGVPPQQAMTNKSDTPLLPDIDAPVAAPGPRRKKNTKKNKANFGSSPSPRGRAAPRERAAVESGKATGPASAGRRPKPPPTARSSGNPRPKTTPLPDVGIFKAAEPRTVPRRHDRNMSSYAATQSVDHREEPLEQGPSVPKRPSWRASYNSSSAHEPSDGTGLWRKTRTRFTAVTMIPNKSGFFSAERGHGRYVTPRIQPIVPERTAVQKWQSAANRSKRVEGAWKKFQAFDTAVTQWVDHNRMLLEQQAAGHIDGTTSTDPSAKTAGDFLLVASTLHRLCRQSIASAATHVSRTSSMLYRAEGDEDKGDAVRMIKLNSVTLNPKLLHHQLAAECVPVKVALGQVKPLVMLKRSLERARLAEGRRKNQ